MQKEYNKNSQQVLSTYLLEVRSYSKCFKYHPYNRPIRSMLLLPSFYR